MKLSSLILGVGVGLLASQGGDAIPQAYGIDLDGILGQYLPAILGIVTVLINESENIPTWLKKIVQSVLKEKGADIETGSQAIKLWQEAVRFLEELRKDPEAEEMAIESAQDLVTALNRKVIAEASK